MIGRHFFICLASLLPSLSSAQTVQGQWQALYQSAWQQTPYTLTQQEISQFPTELWKSDATYPNFALFNWHDLRVLKQIAHECQPVTPDKPTLQRAIEFELSLCRETPLSVDWFQKNSTLHPAGRSYADRYLAHFDQSGLQSPKDILRYTTVANPLHPLHQRLASLSEQGRDALVDGYRAWLENDTLWLGGESGWKAVPAKVWQPLANQANLDLQGTSCTVRYSNLCIAKQPSSSLSLKMALILASVICACFIARMSFLKHKQQREKRFILQLLTHELRTPITSLGLTVDMFRHHFDSLDEHLQEAFWRLVSDYQRLAQLTENSKTYLSANHSDGLLRQSASFEAWLDFYCEKNEVSYCLNQDRQLKLPYYWLAICLENLIKNAKQHGKGTVTVHATLSNKVTIEVRDEGQFPSWWQRVIPSSKPQQNNMGIGLDIVQHLMKMAKGKLIILRHPTRCILELPYEHNSID